MSCSDRETKCRADHKEARLRAWHATGSLYSTRAEAALTQRIRDAMAAEFGPVRETTEPPGDVMEASDEGGAHTLVEKPAMTFGEVGAVLGLSPQRVQQIEVRALAKLEQAFRVLAIVERRGRR